MARAGDDWVRVLLILYRTGQSRVRKGNDTLVHEADVERLRENNEDIELVPAIEYLLDVGLLERVGSELVLTSEGFRVAHEIARDRNQAARERRRAEREADINRAGVYVTIGLLIVALFEFLVFGYDRLGVSDSSIVVSLLVGAALVLWIIVRIGRQELLTPSTSDRSENVAEHVGYGHSDYNNRDSAEDERNELKE